MAVIGDYEGYGDNVRVGECGTGGVGCKVCMVDSRMVNLFNNSAFWRWS